jgi:type I restriction enzyme M protein
MKTLPGSVKQATMAEVEANNFVLTPGRYVGTEEVEDDGVSFDEKVAEITGNLKTQFEQSIQLQQRIKENLLKIGIKI